MYRRNPRHAPRAVLSEAALINVQRGYAKLVDHRARAFFYQPQARLRYNPLSREYAEATLRSGSSHFRVVADRTGRTLPSRERF